MLSPNGLAHNHSNGTTGTNGHGAQLHCENDYEAVNATPYTPSAHPVPWRSQFPAFTHNLGWTDGDGCTHSLTLRNDNLNDLMADLKMLKGLIRASKQKATVANPGAHQGQTQEELVVCKVHGVAMERRISKRMGGHYHCHRMGVNDLCFGRPRK